MVSAVRTASSGILSLALLAASVGLAAGCRADAPTPPGPEAAGAPGALPEGARPPSDQGLPPACLAAWDAALADSHDHLISSSGPGEPARVWLLDGEGDKRLDRRHLSALVGQPVSVPAHDPLPAAQRERLAEVLRPGLAGARSGAASPAASPDASPSAPRARITVDYPLADALFPPEAVAPVVHWHDPTPRARAWVLSLSMAAGRVITRSLVAGYIHRRPVDPRCDREDNRYIPTPHEAATRSWRPDPLWWEVVRHCAGSQPVSLELLGFDPGRPAAPISEGATTFAFSADPVDAPIFFRDVPLPFRFAIKNLGLIRWRLGDVGSPRPPRTLLENMPVCANCHSFSADGRTLAMDVDYASDKGSYAVVPVQPETLLDREHIITWSDFDRANPAPTFGLLSRISPDGRYVLSTVKDLSVFVPVPELHYSQLFFPIRGILAVYDRQQRRFFALPGADDPAFVQSNPVWSPDGSEIVFARAPAFDITPPKDSNSAILKRGNLREFVEEGRELQYDRFSMLVDGKTRFRYDLYRIPFAGGRGGTPRPIPGASDNGRSNYFPTFSPDGRFLVFCQADSFMLLQPDSTLQIMPAAGGEPRPLRANLPGRMNSWHSFAPNGRWLVFASKANGPYTQLWLTHIDADGVDSPAVLLEHFTPANRAANIPEFVNLPAERLQAIRETFTDHYSYFRQGFQYYRLDDLKLAEQHLRRALELKPDDRESHEYLARTLERQGRFEQAALHYNKALAQAEDKASLLVSLAAVRVRAGQAAAAVADLERVLAAQPRHPQAAQRLAWLLATLPDPAARQGRRAVRLVRRVCALRSPPDPDCLDVLAAAYAEVGRFDAATRAATQALEGITNKRDARVAAISKRRELYRQRKPYRLAQ